MLLSVYSVNAKFTRFIYVVDQNMSFGIGSLFFFSSLQCLYLCLNFSCTPAPPSSCMPLQFSQLCVMSTFAVVCNHLRCKDHEVALNTMIYLFGFPHQKYALLVFMFTYFKCSLFFAKPLPPTLWQLWLKEDSKIATW